MSEPASIPEQPSSPAGRFGRPWVLFVAASLSLAAILAWIYLYQSDDGDLYAYQAYAQYYNYKDSSFEDLYSDNTVEYPPLAVVLMIATEDAAQVLPIPARLVHALPPDTYDPAEEMESFTQFKLVYRLEMAAVIFATFLLLYNMLKRSMPVEPLRDRAVRLAVFSIGIALLAPLALDRLDVVLGALLLLGLGLLQGRGHYLWSFIVLAVAVAFKFVPVILAPLWVIGSLPVEMLAVHNAPGGWRRLLFTVARRGALLAALIVLPFVPFVIAAGSDSLAFFTYHSERGIEYGSTYAAFLAVLKYTTGLKISAPSNYGSHDIESSLSPMLTHLAPVIVLLLLAAASLLFLANLARASALRSSQPAAEDGRAARVFAGLFTQHTMLLMLLFIFANKVFSPQYLLWLLPLAPLMPLPRGRRELFYFTFLALCLVTLLIYPVFMDDTLGLEVFSNPDTDLFAGPSASGTLLLAGRVILMAGMIAGLTIHLLRQAGLQKKSIIETADETGNDEGLAIDASPAL